MLCDRKYQSGQDSIIPLVPFVWNRTLIALWRSITCFEGCLSCNLLLIHWGLAWNDLIIHHSLASDRRADNENRYATCIEGFNKKRRRRGFNRKRRRRERELRQRGFDSPSVDRKPPPICSPEKVSSELSECNWGATVRFNTSNVLRPSFPPPSTTGVDSTKPTWVVLSYQHVWF